MFGTKHKNHEFEKINTIYQHHVEKINHQAQILKKKLNKLYDQMDFLEMTIKNIKHQKDVKISEISIVAEKCHQRLENELKERLVNLSKEKIALAEEINCFDDMHTHITEQVKRSAKNVLITKSEEIVGLIKEINEKSSIKIDETMFETEFESDIVPNYKSAVFHL